MVREFALYDFETGAAFVAGHSEGMRSEEDLGAEPKSADEYYERQRRDGTEKTWVGIVHVGGASK